jgi:hypothetical protein
MLSLQFDRISESIRAEREFDLYCHSMSLRGGKGSEGQTIFPVPRIVLTVLPPFLLQGQPVAASRENCGIAAESCDVVQLRKQICKW